jgi:hypothetical protein
MQGDRSLERISFKYLYVAPIFENVVDPNDNYDLVVSRISCDHAYSERDLT